MILRVNGEEKRFAEEVRTIRQLLDVLSVACERIAVEHNGEIVDPEAFADTHLQEEDTLEIVTFVGGG